MADQQWLAEATQKIHKLRAGNLHGLAQVGRCLDEVMQKQGWDVPKALGYFRHVNRSPVPISLVMAVLTVRLYRKAPTWADSADHIQLKALPSDLAELVELVELVEEQLLSDVTRGMGIPASEGHGDD